MCGHFGLRNQYDFFGPYHVSPLRRLYSRHESVVTPRQRPLAIIHSGLYLLKKSMPRMTPYKMPSLALPRHHRASRNHELGFLGPFYIQFLGMYTI
jgi:hypothetical protein